MNNHFVSVADKLNLDLPEIDLDSLGLQYHPPVFDLQELSISDVTDAISQLNNTQLFGDDGITTFMVKSVSTSIFEPLKHIFNLA